MEDGYVQFPLLTAGPIGAKSLTKDMSLSQLIHPFRSHQAPASEQEQQQEDHSSRSDQGVAAEPPPSCIRFERQGEGEQLLSLFIEPSTFFSDGIATDRIIDWIRAEGCGDWLVHSDAVGRLAADAAVLAAPSSYIVAERTHCRVDVQVAHDRLSAWISVEPAHGGEALTEIILRQALVDAHVSFGVKEDLIQQIVESGACDQTVIAEGVAPVHGEPAVFEHLVKDSDHKGAPQLRENGTADLKNLGLFMSVEAGTPLLKRIPPTKGTPGTGVDGSAIPATDGVDKPIHAGVGVGVSPDDPNVIVASRAGQPAYQDNSVRVDPTIELDGVNPGTGNVIFEGNVLIRGPVEAGFTVKAGQDLRIFDTVEGADLSAGRNLVLMTGVYGKNRSKITVEGNLEARFLNECTVDCGGDIQVADLIAHCTAECEGTLRLGQQGGRGQGLGGRLLALRGVQAQILGSVSEMPTIVEIAAPQRLLRRKSEVAAAVDKAEADLEMIGHRLRTAEAAGADEAKLKKAKELQALASSRLEELKKEQEKIEQKLEVIDKARIRSGKVHRGVHVSIGSYRRSISDLMTDVDLQKPPDPPPAPPKNDDNQ